jgi:hypothetical protein
VSPETYRTLDGVADAFNPLLTMLALLAPGLGKQRGARVNLAYYLAAILALAVVYAAMGVERSGLWQAVGVDYSTHSAYAAALVVSIVMLRRKWAAPLLAVLGAYLALVVIMRYHGVAETLLSAALGAVGATVAYLLCSRLLSAVQTG